MTSSAKLPRIVQAWLTQGFMSALEEEGFLAKAQRAQRKTRRPPLFAPFAPLRETLLCLGKARRSRRLALAGLPGLAQQPRQLGQLRRREVGHQPPVQLRQRLVEAAQHLLAG